MINRKIHNCLEEQVIVYAIHNKMNKIGQKEMAKLEKDAESVGHEIRLPSILDMRLKKIQSIGNRFSINQKDGSRWGATVTHQYCLNEHVRISRQNMLYNI